MIWLNAWVVCLPLLFAASNAGGESLSYDDVVGEALRNSARLQVKKEEILISEATYRQSLSTLYPTLALNGRLERFNSLSSRDRIGTINGAVVGGLEDEWRSSIYVLGEYALTNWFKKRYESRYYEKITEASVFESEAEKKKIVLEITDLYGSLSEGALRLRYLERMIGKMQESLVLKTAAHREGEISYEDLVRADVQVVDLEKERAEVFRQFKENMTRLTLYTGTEYDEDAKPSGLIVGQEAPGRVDPERIDRVPEYQAKKKELEAHRERDKAARNNLLPEMGLYGRYDLYGRSADLYESMRETQKTAFSGGLYLSIPLFDGGLRKWERERSTREIRRQEELLRAVKEEKRRDSAGLFVKVRELDRTIGHYRTLLQRYEEILLIASGAAALGARSRAELLESEKEVLAIERDLEVYLNQRAVLVKKYFLETDFASAMGYLDGNGIDRN